MSKNVQILVEDVTEIGRTCMMMPDAGLSKSWDLCNDFPSIPNSLRIYKVALALGDYLKVRAHACIGGRT